MYPCPFILSACFNHWGMPWSGVLRQTALDKNSFPRRSWGRTQGSFSNQNITTYQVPGMAQSPVCPIYVSCPLAARIKFSILAGVMMGPWDPGILEPTGNVSFQISPGNQLDSTMLLFSAYQARKGEPQVMDGGKEGSLERNQHLPACKPTFPEESRAATQQAS